MTGAESPRDRPADVAGQDVAGQEAAAQQAADRLALALEEVGFDVGRAFPVLCAVLDINGSPAVLLGRVEAAVAEALAAVLVRAAGLGVTARS